MRKSRLAVVAILAASGCTAVQVKSVEHRPDLKHVCIQENPKVIVSDFVTVLRDGFDRHGISTELISGMPPDQCAYLLTYTAHKTWDMASYLHHAELRLEYEGRLVGKAEYHLRGKGGFSLMKWQDTKTKMDPVIDELLKAYGS